MDKKLRDLLERTLKATTPLTEMGAEHDSAFLNVLLGIYRVSFTTLRDIYYLSLNEGTGASALDLARKIMEYGIAVEYMIWKGKERKAKQFQEFMFVELHNTFEFLKAIGQDISNHGDKQFKSIVQDYEQEYLSLNSDLKKRTSWAGLSADQMIEQMHKAGELRDFDFSRLGEGYVWGSRLNHVSPIVVTDMMNQDTTKSASDFYLQQAIMFALFFYFRLSTRYIDEMRLLSGTNVQQELADAITSLRDELNNIKPENLAS